METRPNNDTIIDFYNKYPFPNDTRILTHQQTIHHWKTYASPHAKNILVVGCGTGEELHHIRQNHQQATITALEPSINAYTIAQQNTTHLNINLINTTLEDYTTTTHYDHIICSGVLHHLKDPLAALQKLTQLMTTTGTLHLNIYHNARHHAHHNTPNESQYHDEHNNPRETTYNWHDITTILQQQGLNIIRINSILPPPRTHITQKIYDIIFHIAQQQSMTLITTRATP